MLAFCHDPEVQDLVARALRREATPVGARLLLLEVIARAPAIDSHRRGSPAPLVPRRTTSGSCVSRWQSFAAGVADLDDALLRVARDRQRQADVRVDALAAVVPRLSQLDPPLFGFLGECLPSEQPILLRLSAAGVLGRAPLDESQLDILTDLVSRAGAIGLSRLLPAYERTRAAPRSGPSSSPRWSVRRGDQPDIRGGPSGLENLPGRSPAPGRSDPEGPGGGPGDAGSTALRGIGADARRTATPRVARRFSSARRRPALCAIRPRARGAASARISARSAQSAPGATCSSRSSIPAPASPRLRAVRHRNPGWSRPLGDHRQESSEAIGWSPPTAPRSACRGPPSRSYRASASRSCPRDSIPTRPAGVGRPHRLPAVAQIIMVVLNAKPPFPEQIGEDKLYIAGRGFAGRFLQVIYILEPDHTVFVIHARPLNDREKKRFRRRTRK